MQSNRRIKGPRHKAEGDSYIATTIALISEQLIHARFGPRLRINGFDDDGAGEAVRAVLGREVSGYDHGVSRNFAI